MPLSLHRLEASRPAISRPSDRLGINQASAFANRTKRPSAESVGCIRLGRRPRVAMRWQLGPVATQIVGRLQFTHPNSEIFDLLLYVAYALLHVEAMFVRYTRQELLSVAEMAFGSAEQIESQRRCCAGAVVVQRLAGESRNVQLRP